MKDDKLRDILSGLIIFVDTNGRGGINVDQAIEAILKDYVHREEVDQVLSDKCKSEVEDADTIKALQIELKTVKEEHEEVLKELASCTPNGSEFIGNVSRCISYIKDTQRASCEQRISLIKRRKSLEAELKVVKEEREYHLKWTKDIARELGCSDASRYRNDALAEIKALKEVAKSASNITEKQLYQIGALKKQLADADTTIGVMAIMDKAVVLPEKKVYSWGIDQRGMFPSEQYRLEKHGTDNYNQAIDEVARLNKNVVTVEDIEHTILEQYKSDSGFSALAQAIYNLLNGGGK